MSQYTSLSWSAVHGQLKMGRHDSATHKLNWNDSALLVLDDFTKHAPLHIQTDTELAAVDALLSSSPLRYACVLNRQDELVGVVAARDLHGRRSVQIAHELQLPWGEVAVSYLMKPVASLPLITRDQLKQAAIGDAVATLQKSGKDFLLVHQHGDIQGVVAALGIVEKTGESVNVQHHASSFAEIMHAVKHCEEVD
jgi:signal-transduction protein with cAMP-binding, CBS, and nucleotidyltransferase domain